MDLPIIDIKFEDYEAIGYGLVNRPAIQEEGIFLSEQDTLEPSDEMISNLLSKGEIIDRNEYLEIDEKIVQDEDINEINLSADDASEQDNRLFKIRYEYAPDTVKENSRKFCKALAGSGLVFRKEDLTNSNMNPGFGPNGAESYDIWRFKGGVGCGHYWKRKIFLKKKNKEIGFYEAYQKIKELDKKSKNTVTFPTNPKEVAEVASADNNYWKLSLEEVGEIKLSSQERRLVVAPLLIPDQKIKRRTPNGDVYIRFKRDEIEKYQRDFRKKGYGANATYEHKVKIADGVNMVEDWLIEFEQHDKSKGYGFDYKEGTWMTMLSIENDEIWNDYVKTGKVRGLSIELRSRKQVR